MNRPAQADPRRLVSPELYEVLLEFFRRPAGRGPFRVRLWLEFGYRPSSHRIC